MTKTKKGICCAIIISLLALMCLGLVGCGDSSDLTLSGHESLSIAVDGNLDTLLSGVTLTYKVSETETETFTGYAAMQKAGVSVMWSGSSQEVKDSGRTCVVSFAYKSATVSCEYTIN